MPFDFDIFSPLTVRKPWMWTFRGRLKPAVFSIAGQNSVWKYVMSLPMKWCTSVSGLRHQSVEILAVPVAPLAGRAQVADGGVEPHVPVLARAVRDLEAEIGGRARDVPVAQRLAEEMPLKVVGHLRLQGPAAVHPLGQKTVPALDVDEQVPGRADLRLGPRERAHRVDQVGRAEVRQALLATVAVLLRGLALGAGPLDEAVGQKRARHGIEKLGHVPLGHQAGPRRARQISSQQALASGMLVLP